MGFWGDMDRREAARARFEQRMAIPMLVAAALLLGVTLALLFADLSRTARRTLVAVDGVIWLFFVADYLVRVALSTRRRRFLREEWLDLLLVVLPLLQPLRLAGVAVRLTRMGVVVRKTAQGARALVGRHRLDLALGWAGALVLTAAVVTPLVEPANSTIRSFGDAVWWSLVTTTTVGYGDVVPLSVAGRVVGAMLMLAGISIIGLLTANIASYFLEPHSSPTEPEHPEPPGLVPDRLDAIERKLDELMRRLDEQRRAEPP